MEDDKILEAAENTIFSQAEVFSTWIKSFCTWENLFKLITTILVLIILWIVYKVVLHTIRKSKTLKLDRHHKVLTEKIVRYVFFIIACIYILELFGINLKAVWGAAGIAGVAIGFASQTSVSNIISGLFILGEKALKIGDSITVGGVTGTVDSITLLSVRVRTAENQLVRIPNSSIINTTLTNNSFFKNKRISVNISVSYDCDVQKALELLKKAAILCPEVLEDPAPETWCEGIGGKKINLVLACWYKKDDFLQVKNDLYIAVKKVFYEEGIEICG